MSARGCGASRVQGGVYFECGMSPHGRPVEDFLLDPPVPSTMTIAAQGVALIERGGVTYIVDIVGSCYYPNVADFVEEVRHLGVSRRLPQTLAFERLTAESRLLVVHARAWVDNADEYRPYPCPRHLTEHGTGMTRTHCSGVWWRDVDGGKNLLADGYVNRRMPSFTYWARPTPPCVIPVYRQAFFASFPCSRIVVVRGNHEAALAQARKASVPVEEVDE